MTSKSVKAIDLFAGAGGFSLAALNEGMDVVAAVELNSDACETYSKNLIDTLKDRFEKNEITIVLNIIKALPNYRTA